jgi:hypothetical protein
MTTSISTRVNPRAAAREETGALRETGVTPLRRDVRHEDAKTRSDDDGALRETGGRRPVKHPEAAGKTRSDDEAESTDFTDCTDLRAKRRNDGFTVPARPGDAGGGRAGLSGIRFRSFISNTSADLGILCG